MKIIPLVTGSAPADTVSATPGRRLPRRAGSPRTGSGRAASTGLGRAPAGRAAEEVAQLRDMLRGTRAYLKHVLATSRADEHAQCASLLAELALLEVELDASADLAAMADGRATTRGGE